MHLNSRFGKNSSTVPHGSHGSSAGESPSLVIFPYHCTCGANDATSRRKLRIALYSHDTMGLGHMRRNLLIAQTLTAPPLSASILMVAGACQISKFTLPAGVDCLSLPSLCKKPNGEYGSRNLDVSLGELSRLRAKTITAALQSFRPDLLIVDNVPRGALGELDQVLCEMRGQTQLVLGLRDVLDAPERVREEWSKAQNFETIRAYYDAIWVYGDREVYDLVREYNFPADIAQKVRFVGYLDQRARLQEEQSNFFLPIEYRDRQLAVCSVGGGQDGVSLAEAFMRADLPRNFNGVVLTGPFMPSEARQRLQQLTRSSRLQVVDFMAEPLRLLSRADRIVSMAGYNSSCEMLSLGIPALLVPRATPRVEQLLRAERLSSLGYADVLHPDQLTSQAISKWLAQEPTFTNKRRKFDLDGLSRLPELAEEVLALSSKHSNRPLPQGGLRHAVR